jgi:hypothetical protein
MNKGKSMNQTKNIEVLQPHQMLLDRKIMKEDTKQDTEQDTCQKNLKHTLISKMFTFYTTSINNS